MRGYSKGGGGGGGGTSCTWLAMSSASEFCVSMLIRYLVFSWFLQGERVTGREGEATTLTWL